MVGCHFHLLWSQLLKTVVCRLRLHMNIMTLLTRTSKAKLYCNILTLAPCNLVLCEVALHSTALYGIHHGINSIFHVWHLWLANEITVTSKSKVKNVFRLILWSKLVHPVQQPKASGWSLNTWGGVYAECGSVFAQTAFIKHHPWLIRDL